MDNQPIVFISHSSKDKNIALALQKVIHDAFQGSFNIFNSSDLDSIVAGENWQLKLIEQIRKCKALLVIATDNGLRSQWVNLEIGGGLISERTKVIPCCANGMKIAELPEHLRGLQAVDISTGEGLQKLMKALKRSTHTELPKRFRYDHRAKQIKQTWEDSKDNPHEYELTATIVEESKNIYAKAIELINNEHYHWARIRIFAPVGFWESEPYKREWLLALNGAIIARRVGRLEAIYGFPHQGMKLSYDRNLPIIERGVEDQLAKSHLTNTGTHLRIFDDTPNTNFRFIPPVEISVGSGAILFESREGLRITFCGFSQGLNYWITEVGINFEGSNAVHEVYRSWFDDALWTHSTATFLLKDHLTKPPVTLSSAWEKIMKKYYRPTARVSWTSIPIIK